ncbi:1-acyl-sn-glycerol-3-phosphate acyltransferase [Rhodococcus sp. ABRD24]|nr:1-acyl-sn-glycerol-3-phosphate acyltransferase [Rhodococcus sp. ABRD24]
MALVLVASSSLLLPATRLLPSRWRTLCHRSLARTALRSIGIRLSVERRERHFEGGSLVVAGHVSWLDILVLAAVTPGQFVARADLLTWPLLGALARRVRVIPIERDRLRSLPLTVAAAREHLRSGDTVIVFPEGTTWCGRAFGRFRPALFQAAIDAQRPVQPVTVHYEDRSDAPTTEPCFVGDESIGRSMRRVLRAKGLRARVVLEAPQQPGTDRRELAERCERLVRREADLGADGIVAQLMGRRHVDAA